MVFRVLGSHRRCSPFAMYAPQHAIWNGVSVQVIVVRCCAGSDQTPFFFLVWVLSAAGLPTPPRSGGGRWEFSRESTWAAIECFKQWRFPFKLSSEFLFVCQMSDQNSDFCLFFFLQYFWVRFSCCDYFQSSGISFGSRANKAVSVSIRPSCLWIFYSCVAIQQ